MPPSEPEQAVLKSTGPHAVAVGDDVSAIAQAVGRVQRLHTGVAVEGEDASAVCAEDVVASAVAYAYDEVGWQCGILCGEALQGCCSTHGGIDSEPRAVVADEKRAVRTLVQKRYVAVHAGVDYSELRCVHRSNARPSLGCACYNNALVDIKC